VDELTSSPLKELDGAVCVVTGAGRGIGRHVAEAFAREGADLALCARSLDELEAVRAGIVERYGVRVAVRAVDVSSDGEVAGFARAVCDELGPARVLVNNAAVYGPVGPLTDVDLTEWVHALRVDLLGVVHGIRHFVPLMEASGGGHVVNLAGGGTGGPRQFPNVSAYTCAKAAVVSLTETLAKELAPKGVWINAMAPGPVSTSFLDPVIRAGPALAGDDLYESSVRQREAGDPLDNVGRLAVFLASRRSAGLTGRLLSAKWDPLDEIEAELEQTGDLAASRYTLRRIDGVLFAAVQS
jgi:NAD(P)-dependent dehydrogenase (short-subunit alcohol dehydrogenase family)